MSKQETPQLFLYAFDLRGGGALHKRLQYSITRHSNVRGVIRPGGAGAGAVSGIQCDGNIDLVVKKASV